ncbi:MAG: hypothetical protein WBQ25_11105 [Nitrososphaeraceae archaeon]
MSSTSTELLTGKVSLPHKISAIPKRKKEGCDILNLATKLGAAILIFCMFSIDLNHDGIMSLDS